MATIIKNMTLAWDTEYGGPWQNIKLPESDQRRMKTYKLSEGLNQLGITITVKHSQYGMDANYFNIIAGDSMIQVCIAGLNDVPDDIDFITIQPNGNFLVDGRFFGKWNETTFWIRGTSNVTVVY